MAALQVNGQWLPKIKVSASREKTTLPSHKQVYRLYHRNDQTAFADVIALADENLPAEIAAVNANPLATQTQVTLRDFTAEPLLKPVFLKHKIRSQLMFLPFKNICGQHSATCQKQHNGSSTRTSIRFTSHRN